MLGSVRGGPRTSTGDHNMKTFIGVTASCVIIAAGTTGLYRLFRPGWVSYRKGEICFVAKQYADAVDSYRRAIDGGLAQPEIYLGLVEAQLALHSHSDAANTARAYAASRGCSPKALHVLGELFVGNGQFDVAIELLRDLVRENPENRKTRFRLAQILTWTQEFDAAIEHYHILLGDEL